MSDQDTTMQEKELFRSEQRSAVERASLQAALPLFIATYLVMLVVLLFVGAERTIDSDVLRIVVSGTTSAIAFFTIFLSFWRRQVHTAREANRELKLSDWFFSAMVIAIGYAVVVAAGAFAVMSAVGEAFKGLNYGPFVGAVWPALGAAIICYWGVSVGAFAKLSNIMRLVALYLVVGVLIAGIANPNPDWWRISISYLGMHQLKSATVFNVSIMIAALLFLASSIFTFPTFTLARDHSLMSPRSCTFAKFAFIWAPCGLFLVGACPYGSSAINTFLHNFGAYTMFFVMGLMMLLSGRLMPFLSKPFLRVNYVLFASLIVMGLFYVIPPHMLTLGLFEALGIAVIAVWLMLMLTAFENRLSEEKGFSRNLSERQMRVTHQNSR